MGNRWSGDGLSAGPYTGQAGTGDTALGVVGSGVSIVGSGSRPPQIEIASQAGYVYWTFGTRTQGAYRTYWTAPSSLPTNNVIIAKNRVDLNGANSFWISLANTGAIRVFQLGGTQVGASEISIAPNARYRIEWRLDHGDGGTTSGKAEVRIYSDATGALLDTITLTGISLGVNHNTVIWSTDSTANAIGATRYDDMAEEAGYTFIGPYVSTANEAPTASLTGPNSVASGAEFTLNVSSGDSDGTVASAVVTQTAGPAIELSGTGSTRTGRMPYVDVTTPVTFRLRVTDDDGAVTDSTKTIQITKHLRWLGSVPLTASVVEQGEDVQIIFTVDAVGDSFIDTSWKITPGDHQVQGAYLSHGGPDKNGNPWESALRPEFEGTQRFGNLTNGVTYQLAFEAVVDGVRISPVVRQGTPKVPITGGMGTVAKIGDSLSFRSTTTATGSREATTRQRLVDLGGFLAENIGWWARGGKSMVNADTGGKTALQNIADMKAQLGNVDHWIIGLGTNDTALSSTAWNKAVSDILTAIGSHGKVYWVGLAYYGVNNSNAVDKNPLTKALVEARPNSYFLDWNTYIHHPDRGSQSNLWIYPTDSTHMTTYGYQLRDEFEIAAILDDGGGNPPPPPAGGKVGLYNGNEGTADDGTLAAFGNYPGTSTLYVQPEFAGWEVAKLKKKIDRGIIPVLTWTTKYTQWIADMADPTRPGHAAAVAKGDRWIAMVNEIAVYGAARGVPVYATTSHEYDVYSNQSRTDIYYTGDSAIHANYGKCMTRFLNRAKQDAPSAKWGIWFGGFQTGTINTVLANLNTNPDWISEDPYVNGKTYESALQNFTGPVNRYRSATGLYNGHWKRLGSPPLAITEHGISKNNHSDQACANYHNGVKSAVASLNLLFATFFNRDSGPNGSHKMNDGAHPLAVAAVANSLKP